MAEWHPSEMRIGLSYTGKDDPFLPIVVVVGVLVLVGAAIYYIRKKYLEHVQQENKGH